MKNQLKSLTTIEASTINGGGTSDVGEWFVDTIASGICIAVNTYEEFSSRLNEWGSSGYAGGRFTA